MCLPQEHGHTTETCRSLQYLVERLIKAGHLKQYLRSDAGGKVTSQHHNPGAPRAPAAPKAVINYINGGPSDEEYDSRRKRQKLWDNHFPTSRSHPDTTATSRRPHPVPRDRRLRCKRVLVDPGSSAILYKHRSLATWDTVSQALKTLDESCPDSTDHQLHPWETLYCRSKLAQSLSTYNSRGTRVITLQYHLGRTWLHYMKAIPSTYHQMVSFLTNEGQIDLYGSQCRSPMLSDSTRSRGQPGGCISP
ncbi:hypothetical protein CK203_028412 [Vitis vinifera]|uniref:Uncharacterized protein n=1 Tax=Vitis vinifera TaxID=29760 RepID=A0A438J086_VITVI|nr:hypothetical protein CK203_028412 [Vitis vinifera]